MMAIAGPLRAEDGGELLSPEDRSKAETAFKAVEADDWRAVRRLAGDVRDPVLADILRWIDMTRPGTDAPFNDIAAFLLRNPQWPGKSAMRGRAEEAMPTALPHDEVLAWFNSHPPVTAEGRIRRIAALFGTGQTENARGEVRKAWIEGNFGKRQQQDFYRRYRRALTPEDHRKRVDRLIWEDRYWPARRMLALLDRDWRKLAEARLKLMRKDGGVDKAIAAVPHALKSHPGLIYERVRWRRRKGRHLSARELLEDLPPDLVRPDKWWSERSILARDALQSGHISEAYRIAKEHGLIPEAGLIGPFAEAEWLAGWIALRFLQEPGAAMDHFVAMHQAVRFPISRSRAAYWSGRSAEAMEIPRLADLWFEAAARYPTTYHGQLAAQRLDPGGGLNLPPVSVPGDLEERAFAKHELTRAVNILASVGGDEHLRPFLIRLRATSDEPTWKASTAALALEIDRPDLAIHISKIASRAGHELIDTGYPIIEVPPPGTAETGPDVEAPLVLAVVRQESAFRMQARSRAGARGLMQLMPRTARMTAKQLKLKYERARLTADAEYNLRLGRAYLGEMIERFDGSYVLALAAYNAGPSRAVEWIRKYGNPQDTDVDVIDWIETIPFLETRNYIHRVMENLQVYRALLATTDIALALERDLYR